VMNHPRRGMFVNMLNEEDCAKINSLRIILEAEALKLCRARFTAAYERHLASLLEKLENWQAGSEIEAAALDLEFHRAIWNYSGNGYLEKILNSLVPVLFAHQALENISHVLLPLLLHHHLYLLAVVHGQYNKSTQV